MIVVADTRPLNYLIRLGRIELLQLLYGEVTVPPAVLSEMQHVGAPAQVRAWALSPPVWLKKVDAPQTDGTLHQRLGMGEREAISLALELRADALLIDESAGRAAAKTRQISVIGTLAVLLQAAFRGLVVLPDELERLRQLNFRISTSIEAALLKSYNNEAAS